MHLLLPQTRVLPTRDQYHIQVVMCETHLLPKLWHLPFKIGFKGSLETSLWVFLNQTGLCESRQPTSRWSDERPTFAPKASLSVRAFTNSSASSI